MTLFTNKEDKQNPYQIVRHPTTEFPLIVADRSGLTIGDKCIKVFWKNVPNFINILIGLQTTTESLKIREPSLETPTEEKIEIDLDALQVEVDKLQMLLKDRHPGLATWNLAFHSRLKTIKAIYASLGG